MEKDYLGDGVYVERDAFGNIVLTTENGYRTTNTIILEPETLAALLEWVTSRTLQQHGRK